MDRLTHFQTHFGRFLWDIVGVFFLAFALMTLLGILNLSKGTLLEEWVRLLYLWFGWGDLLMVLLAGIIGVLAFRRSRQPLAVHWGRITFLEIAAFLTLAVLALISNNTLAPGRMWGGEIGWGLAQLFVRIKFLGPLWGGIIIVILWVLALVSGLGLWRPLEGWLLEQAGEPEIKTSDSPQTENPVVSPLVTDKPAASAATRKTPAKLPPEFRKSFKVSEREDNRSVTPPPRGERLPPLNVLLGEQNVRPDERNINQTAGLIEKSLSEFGIPAKVVGFRIGPTVTQFAVQPGFIRKGTEEDAQQMKVRVAQIANLQKDLGVIATRGRIVVIGNRGMVEINARLAMNKDAAILGMALNHATPAQLAGIHAALVEGLRNGSLRPVIAQEFPLDCLWVAMAVFPKLAVDQSHKVWIFCAAATGLMRRQNNICP